MHPLPVSAFVGNFVLFKHVLARIGEINAMNSNGWQALHFAVLRHILKKNRNKEYYLLGRVNEMPIISLMDKIGYLKILPDPEISCLELAMLKYKELPKSLETYKEMKSCLSYEHFEIVALIMKETSKINFKNPEDKDGWTPLHLAAYRGQVDLCQKIIEETNYSHRPSNNDNSYRQRCRPCPFIQISSRNKKIT